jgi:hypothetical protein
MNHAGEYVYCAPYANASLAFACSAGKLPVHACMSYHWHRLQFCNTQQLLGEPEPLRAAAHSHVTFVTAAAAATLWCIPSTVHQGVDNGLERLSLSKPQ